MKIYILINNRFDKEIDGVYENIKDAQDMIDSCSKDWNFTIEEHEVIQ